MASTFRQAGGPCLDLGNRLADRCAGSGRLGEEFHASGQASGRAGRHHALPGHPKEASAFSRGPPQTPVSSLRSCEFGRPIVNPGGRPRVKRTNPRPTTSEARTGVWGDPQDVGGLVASGRHRLPTGAGRASAGGEQASEALRCRQPLYRQRFTGDPATTNGEAAGSAYGNEPR